MKASDKSGLSALAKAFLVLEIIGDRAAPVSMSEIARAAGLPTSTVHRILQELTELKFLRRETSGEYSVTTRLWVIGARSNPATSLRQALLPALQQLHSLTRAHVLLVVQDDNAALIIERLGSDNIPTPAGRAGARLPLHATSSGKALLAFSAPPLAAKLDMTAYTSTTLTSRQDLEHELARVRQEGVAYSHEEFILNTYSAATPILKADGIAAAALSVIMSAGQPLPSTVITALRHFARIASETLQRLEQPPIDPPQSGLPRLA
jgi:DNA-binding IclR family transcriptional regulator